MEENPLTKEEILAKIAESGLRLSELDRMMQIALIWSKDTWNQHNQARILIAEYLESHIGKEALNKIAVIALLWLARRKGSNWKKKLDMIGKHTKDVPIIVERLWLPPGVRPDRYQGGRLNLTKSDKDQHRLARILIIESLEAKISLESQISEDALRKSAENTLAWVKERKTGNRTFSIPALEKYLEDLPLIIRGHQLPPKDEFKQ